MNDYVKNNKEALLLLKPSYKYFVFILSFILLTIIIIHNLSIYDTYNYDGVFKNNLIEININKNDIKKILNDYKLFINNNESKFKIIRISELDGNYQTIYLSTSDKYLDNEPLKITFIKKQRIIKQLFQKSSHQIGTRIRNLFIL